MAGGKGGQGLAGRKRKVAEEDEEAPDELASRWEWEGDGGVWNVYSDEHAQDITQALRSGNTSVRLPLPSNISLRVDLKKMMQKNSKTGFERSVRYAVKDQEDYYVWQWQDDDALWHPYSAAVCADLERARRKGEGTIVVAVGRVRYSLDIGRMRQVNSKTKYERKMGRVQSDAADAATPSGSSQPIGNSTGASSSTEGSTAAKKPRKNSREQPENKASGSHQGEGDSQDAADATTPSSSSQLIGNSTGASSSADGLTVAKKPRKNSREQPENKASGSHQGEGDSQETVKTILVKGKAAVDSECQAKHGKAHVYCEGDDVYDTLLNQTNLQYNNNKYYIIQLLEDDAKRNFSVWMRWGRVGKVGQNNLILCGTDLNKAKDVFQKKFFDKTKNDWSLRASFEKVPGKYDVLSRDYSGDAPAEKEGGKVAEAAKAPKVESKLDRRVQELIELICNIQAMEEMVIQLKYDTKKAPLGKLTTAQIKAGYLSLQKIEDCMNRNVTGKALVEACNEFYTRIPHDFGLKTPPLIRTKKELQEKVGLLEALSDIEIAIKVVKSELGSTENPLDKQYRSLHCSLQPLEQNTSEFKVIEKYLQSTHASTHNDYTMKLLEVFDVEKEGEKDQFRTDLGNSLGKEYTSQTCPPRVPITALPHINITSDSCFCVSNDVLVPMGPGKETGVENPNGYTLNYNEYVVYNPTQVHMKYLLKVQFDFASLW
ncbi:poly [ADP-ribose] polymerase 2 isoform X2 [Heterodontus francisci]|uniref:poly [ADP-ribose] polymerase 2 isoform X2 n=1 Tax=Heterodontus francisci TaxID=7792 RepID=UPI00355C373C